MTTIWDLLQEMACRDGATAPVVVEGVQILDLADYLEMLLPQLEMVMRESADSSHQSWKGLVGHGRQTDVAGVLPELADCLRRFAAGGRSELPHLAEMCLRDLRKPRHRSLV